MTLFEWGPKYQLGLENIDSQHKILVDLINKTYEMIMSGEKTVYKEILLELIEYSKMHFTYEETIFEKINYQEKEQHSKAHQDFALEISRLVEEMEKPNTSQEIALSSLLLFLKNWLIKHILEEDKRYVDLFLKNKEG
ncbi:MAG: hemerythrin family protein [Halobacteriovoraceae bacterium]|jgi:hemerythrin-like metal-binding protein|nr:hemerythrin family protein [Halobacteriovoraceae bacterium]